MQIFLCGTITILEEEVVAAAVEEAVFLQVQPLPPLPIRPPGPGVVQAEVDIGAVVGIDRAVGSPLFSFSDNVVSPRL